jgi:hypothetical protein
MTYKLIEVNRNEIKEFDRECSVRVEGINSGLGFILYSPTRGIGTAGHIQDPYLNNPNMGEDTNLFDLTQTLNRHLKIPVNQRARDYQFFGFGGRFLDPSPQDPKKTGVDPNLEEFEEFYNDASKLIKSILKKWKFPKESVNLDFGKSTQNFEDFRMIFHPWKNDYKTILTIPLSFPGEKR